MSAIAPKIKWAGQLNSNLAVRLVRDFKAWSEAATAEDKLNLCKSWAAELGLGDVDPHGGRTRRHVKTMLADFRAAYQMLRDNAEVGSDPLCVTAADFEYASKSSEVFNILEPVFVKHLFGEAALQLSTKRSDDPPSGSECESESEAEAESEAEGEGGEESGDVTEVDDCANSMVVQAVNKKGDDPLLEWYENVLSIADCY